MKLRKKGKILEIGGAIINKVLSNNEEIAQERLKVCETCPLNAGLICSGCGCLIKLKIYSDKNNCPEKFWKR
jgi:hypothetical protein